MVIAFHKLTTKNLAALAQRVIYASKNGAYQAPADNELLQNSKRNPVSMTKCTSNRPTAERATR